MGYEVRQEPLTFQHGFTDTHIGVQFSKSIPNILMTPQEARDFIDAIEKSLAAREKHLHG